MSIKFNHDVLDLLDKGGLTVNEALNTMHEEEIHEFRTKNKLDSSVKLNAFEVAMFENGLNKKSQIGEVMNAITTSGNGDYMIPMYIQSTLEELGKADTTLNLVLATTTPEASTAIKTYQFDKNNAKNKEAGRLVRVNEGADLPLAKLTLGSKAISLYKQGRAVEITYEALRRMPFDMLALALKSIRDDIGMQNLWGVTDVALNGDGNANPAIKLGTTATAGLVTQEELNGFLFDYFTQNNVGADTILCSIAQAKKISPFTFDPTMVGGTSFAFKLNFPQLGEKNVNVVMIKDMPQIGSKDAIVLMNKADAIIKHIETNSQINENARLIRNQTTLDTISEVSGFSKFNKESVAYIEIK